uniref:C-type lectin domain-containing protein n=1 Tax=Acrobeloides nanus TaxID=290746 RepID=A0A914CP89_9BILA
MLDQRCCPNLGENPSAQGPCLSGACATGQYCLPSDQQCYILYITSVVPIVTTATTTTTTSPVSTCDPTWTYFSETQDCYKAFTTKLDFTDANSTCISLGGHLVSIHSSSEEAFIYTLAAQASSPSLQPDYFWLGLYAATYPNYSWLDGTPLDYTNWTMGAPSSTMYLCGYYIYKDPTPLWDNYYDCTSTYKFICQKASNV